MNKERNQRSERLTGLIKIEKSINPEEVWGKEFRVSSIIGEGSGLGFKIENLHLPRNWEKKTPKLKEINYKPFYDIFKQECQEAHLASGLIKYDSEGILREVTINTEPTSRLYLNLEFPKEYEGGYKSENIRSPLVAIIMQRHAAIILNILLGKNEKIHRGYPYIVGNWGHFQPINLIVPEKFIKGKKALYSQEAFKIEASNILGRFGFTLRKTSHNENGLLTSFDLNEGNACGFYLSDGVYYPHNVDTPDQAVALFGVGAAYINHLLKYD